MGRQRNIDNQIEQERKKLEALLIISHRAKARSERIIRPIGLTEIFSPSVPASVDVVFVHGIFGHPKETWTCDDTDVFWPAELLPPILENETSRVLTYGYDARADLFPDGDAEHKTRGVIESLGQDLVANRQVLTKPLIRGDFCCFIWYLLILTSFRFVRPLNGLLSSLRTPLEA